MHFQDFDTPERRVILGSLAIVGLAALISLGVWLAVYASQYVPTAINRLGGAAISLSQVFTPAPGASLSVVSTATTTVATTSAATATSTPAAPAEQPAATTPGKETSITYAVGSTTPALYGLPDLIVKIRDTGYLASTTADSFVSTTTVPAHSRPAVVFEILNVGTNATGSWRFSASIPTQTAYIYQSQPQQSLNPGDSIVYTLGFDQATPGADRTISITANFDHAVTESVPDNDSASTKLTVLGS